MPVTNKPKKSEIPTVIICDGKEIKEGLKKAKISSEELQNELKKSGFLTEKEVFYATVDENGSFNFIKKEI